jgi:putative endonuclease
MKEERRQFGTAGERVAANYLKMKGYLILEMNYKNMSGRQLGEIDIIAKEPEKDEIVFVEVKTREFNKYKNTLPEENVTFGKIKRLERIANSYLYSKKLLNGYRFDVIAIWLDLPAKRAKVKHIISI